MQMLKVTTGLPKIQNNIFRSIIKARELEDMELIDIIEECLIQKRKFIFHLPPPKTSVISLMSGGLDTTIVTAILMQEFNLKVFPIYFNRSINNSSKAFQSLKFFTRFYLEKYPKLFTKPIHLPLVFPAKKLSEILLLTHASRMGIIGNTKQERGLPFQPSLYAYYSLQYSQYLQELTNLRIRSIFGAWLPNNGNSFAYETYTALRAVMLELCIMTKDFSWQFTSLPMEKELGFFFDKDVLIKWGHENDIPLENTWSCCYAKKYHCGECGNCIERRDGFLNARVKDKTRYLSNVPLSLK